MRAPKLSCVSCICNLKGNSLCPAVAFGHVATADPKGNNANLYLQFSNPKPKKNKKKQETSKLKSQFYLVQSPHPLNRRHKKSRQQQTNPFAESGPLVL